MIKPVRAAHSVVHPHNGWHCRITQGCICQHLAPASVGFFVVADYGLRHSQNWISVFPRLLGSSPKISPSGYWFSPRRELYKRGFSYPNFIQDSPSDYRFLPRSKLSYRWNGYARFSQRFNWPSVLLNCSQPMRFLSDNSGTHPKIRP